VQGQTQQTARAILSDVSQDIQFNRASFVGTPAPITGQTDMYYFCIGSDVYVYQFDKYLDPSKAGPAYSSWGLVRYTNNSCTPYSSPLTQPGIQPQELLATNQRLGGLYLQQQTLSNGNSAYNVQVEVAYGANDLLNDTAGAMNGNAGNAGYVNGASSAPTNYQYNYRCQDGLDSSFCAYSILTTTVAPRIN
jgi:hypothetical protein